ncbi:proteasome inhibitor PI31 subunit [Rhopalosiphum maidis]|uniref:proteasome inhibitor PI31 subunit n=1 Tax=Rhopalosiphum maidis TaxID=43146 RepID=UPI000EFE502A|nr:proteasome inhibitor PI31 subunit [Rhopalosiphum maidis]
MSEYSSNFWMLVFEFFKKDVQKPEDNLMILVHWLLLKNGFQILELGCEVTNDKNVQPSDILPTNWSQNETYKLQYIRDKELFLLTAVKAAESLVLNLYNVKTKSVTCSAIGNISSTVQWITNLVKNKDQFDETIQLLENELIVPMIKVKEEKIHISTQTNNEPKKSPPLTPVERPLGRYPEQSEPGNPINTFPSYGMSDLDPLGGLRGFGEGMLFHPNARIAGPSNSRRPPMARFDPIRPLNPDPLRADRFSSNPDHMRPPHFDEFDMYM